MERPLPVPEPEKGGTWTLIVHPTVAESRKHRGRFSREATQSACFLTIQKRLYWVASKILRYY